MYVNDVVQYLAYGVCSASWLGLEPFSHPGLLQIGVLPVLIAAATPGIPLALRPLSGVVLQRSLPVRMRERVRRLR